MGLEVEIFNNVAVGKHGGGSEIGCGFADENAHNMAPELTLWGLSGIAPNYGMIFRGIPNKGQDPMLRCDKMVGGGWRVVAVASKIIEEMVVAMMAVVAIAEAGEEFADGFELGDA